jgi:hypothetical protein
VHTYDAEITLGAPRPLPDEAALDGVGEFLSTCCAWAAPWPHEAAAIDFHATEGRSLPRTLEASVTSHQRPGTAGRDRFLARMRDGAVGVVRLRGVADGLQH